MPNLNLALADVFTPATQQQWLTTLLANLGTLGIPATSWQSGSVARTIVTLMSYLGASEDGLISVAAQGGFLDFSSTGTTTYSNAQGQTVTVAVSPDPSTLAGAALAAWLPGWLDILADGAYNVQRIQATQASGTYVLTSAVSVAYGPYAAGTYHVANPTTGASYSNTASLTIAAQNLVGGGVSAVANPNLATITVTTSSAHGLATGAYVTIAGVGGATPANGTWQVTVTTTIAFTLNGSSGNGVSYTGGGTVNVATSGAFAADSPGTAGTSGASTITTQVTSNVGVSGTNLVAFVGTNWETNAALASRCRLKLASLSPNGAAGAYQYFALSASQILGALTTSDSGKTALSLSGGTINRALVTVGSGNGVVTTTVANAAGAVAGVTNTAITAASRASPIVVTVVSTTGFANGDFVYVSGVTGNTAANGYWKIAGLTGTTFQLVNSTGNGAYISGGTVEDGDLGLVDAILQQNVVPNAVTAVTQSAAAQSVAVVATVYVPAAQVTAYTSAVATALANYAAALPIGGLNTDAATNVLPYNDVVGVLFAAGIVAGATSSYVRGIASLTVGGGTVDLAVGATSVVTFTQTITVTGQ